MEANLTPGAETGVPALQHQPTLEVSLVSHIPLAAPRGRRLVAALGATAVAVAGSATLALPAQAASTDVNDVTFAWTLNDESGGGAYFGGCNFLVAGEAGDAGGSRLWTEADGFYQAEDGNVRVEKPNADGDWVAPTWSTKCLSPAGTPVNTSPDSTTGNRIVLSEGSGTVDVAAGTADVSWDGSFTIVFYGGMTYWTVNDPVLSVEADGTGTVTATASGYGADMNDPSKWVSLTPTEIEIATLTGVDVTEGGFSMTPDYLGVEIEVVPGGPSGPQIRTGEQWGGFPQSLVDFNALTGQAAYWYSSGGMADVKKPTNPLTVAWTAEGGADPEPEPEPGEGEVPIEVVVPEDGGTDPEPEPGEFSWTIQGSGAVSLGTASQTAAGFTAAGDLHSILVEDTRMDAPSWSINGQASAFADGSNSFGADALGWVPGVSDNTVGAVPGPAVGPGTGAGLGTSQTLVSAPAGHAQGSTLVGAALELLAPADAEPGSYTSTLTLTALG